jgi:chemotaxis methyl-accepting protein methylase
LSAELLGRIAGQILAETGIQIPEYRWPMVASELRRLGGPDLAVAVARIEAAPELRRRLIGAVAIPETHLFRHPGHFLALATLARERRAQGKPCRVLSAGCSTGEEAWSAAAVLASVYQLEGRDFAVEGWDLDPHRLLAAERGYYRSWSVRGGLHGHDAWFRRDGECWEVNPRLRPFVHFRAHNLMLAPPPGGAFDAIIFRNVAIYWEPATASRVVEQLAARLAQDGLFLPGPSDPVRFPTSHWEVSRDFDSATYRRRLSALSPTPARPAARPALAAVAPVSAPRPPTPRPARPAEPKLAPPAARPAPQPDPGHDAWLSAASAHADAGRYRDALDLLCGQSGPLHGPGRLLMGIVMLALDRTDEAFAWIRQAVFLAPDDPACRQWLAVVHERLGRTSEAERERRNAEELRGDDDRLRTSA